MTQNEIDTINFYRRKGLGYKKISEITGTPQEAVKSYFRRNPAESVREKCLGCGKPIQQMPHRKQKIFCSDTCRMNWWNKHPELVRYGQKERPCAMCGNLYQPHRKTQQFCSRACYADYRRKAVLSE